MLPTSMERPFFAYGIFQPGQLAYFQLDHSVDGWQRAEVPGALLIRDGLPIVDLRKNGTVAGAVLTFKPGDSERAYRRIAAMEPTKHYLWDVVEAAGAEVNLLVGRSPSKGSVPFEKAEWDGWDDPLLTTALDAVQETLDEFAPFAEDLKPLFRLQMAYLLLWSAIERYVSLRHHLGRRSVSLRRSRSSAVRSESTSNGSGGCSAQTTRPSTRFSIPVDRPRRSGTTTRSDPTSPTVARPSLATTRRFAGRSPRDRKSVV